ncbi:MAG TPA: MG2 domain-containing protein, partial [Prolixibacteraceae bacterium]|nr:MG2 domain-containing protein [Prolixibacteraceae bacterium]
MNIKIAFILLGFLTLWSCHSNTKSVDEKDLAKHISKITQGNVDPTTGVVIEFINEMVDDEDLSQSIIELPFKFSPKIKGEAKWESKKRLVFTPSEPLKYGTSYKGILELQKLPGNVFPEEMEQYVFVLNVNNNAITEFKGGIELKSPSSPKTLQYKADFTLASPIETETLQKAIVCELNGDQLAYTLTEKDKGLAFRIVSNDISRDDSNHTLKIKIDKDELGLVEEYAQTEQVPPLSELMVMDITQDKNGKNPKIRVTFSDRISMKQNLDGLIQITPSPGTLNLQRLGKTVMVEGEFRYGNEYKISVHKNIESNWGTKTTQLFEKNIAFPDIDPQVEFASAGVILPSSNQFIVQFYTCNLQRVHLELKKVYNEDLDAFIRNEQISSQPNRKSRFHNNYVSNMGVILHNETFEISNQKNNWELNEIDLSQVIKEHGKGLYLIRLNFNPKDLLTNVSDTYKYVNTNGQVYKPIIMSDIGLMCKKMKGDYMLVATDLKNAKPIEGVHIELKRRYHYSNKYTLKGTTKHNGTVKLKPANEYYQYDFAIASKGTDKTILKFNETEWNVSGYDIGGLNSNQLSTQAFVYTERGVYRPGDEINLSVIARHLNSTFPDDKQVTVELLDPMNKSIYSVTSKENTNGFFNFKFQTQQSDPTGNWTARFYVGNKHFSHTIKIETIVPYKLKTKINLPVKTLYEEDRKLKVDVNCKYLFGTPAGGNPIELIADYSNLKLRFPKYSDFVFSNPTIEFASISKKLDDSKFDDQGLYSKTIDIPEFSGVPSALNLRLSAEVMEKGGRKNKNWENITIHPYSTYVGIQDMESYYKAETDLSIPVVAVNPKGEIISGKTIRYNIYKNERYWWWQYDNRQLRYKSDSYTEL